MALHVFSTSVGPPPVNPSLIIWSYKAIYLLRIPSIFQTPYYLIS